MMNILWKDKTANFDTRNVSKLWFEKRNVQYMIASDGRFMFAAKVSEVESILSDEEYSKTGRQQ